jgi:SagB-type dehydrogenase family enzyme
MPDLKKTSAHKYFQETRFKRNTLGRQTRPSIASSAIYKKYPANKNIILPRTWENQGKSLWDVMQFRRSRRRFSGTAMSLPNLARLLWAAQGITAQAGAYFFRTSPSAGALYPIETYVAAVNIEGVAKGIYHFNVEEFLLEEITLDAHIGKKVAQASLDQNFMKSSSAIFIWSGIFRRNMSKYGNRGGRYICMDAGHICQNLLLAAENLDFSACPVAAFYDDEMNDLLQIDGEEESALYLAAVG